MIFILFVRRSSRMRRTTSSRLLRPTEKLVERKRLIFGAATTRKDRSAHRGRVFTEIGALRQLEETSKKRKIARAR